MYCSLNEEFQMKKGLRWTFIALL